MPATVSSQTTLIPKPLTIITFNKADVVYQAYNHLYQVASFGQSGVEAGADVWGLKVGIVDGSVGTNALSNVVLPQWSSLIVQGIHYDQIWIDGCDHIGTYQISVNGDTMSSVMGFWGLTMNAAAAAGGFLYPT